MLLDGAGFEIIRMTTNDAGKQVSLGFIIERSARVHPILPKLLAPLRPLKECSLYINPRDELLVLARKRAPNV